MHSFVAKQLRAALGRVGVPVGELVVVKSGGSIWRTPGGVEHLLEVEIEFVVRNGHVLIAAATAEEDLGVRSRNDLLLLLVRCLVMRGVVKCVEAVVLSHLVLGSMLLLLLLLLLSVRGRRRGRMLIAKRRYRGK